MPIRRLLAATVVVAAVVLSYGFTGQAVPVVASDNVELVATFPDAGAVSGAISPSAPILYTSTLHGVDVYDISDPTLPALVGSQPLPIWENEGLDLGERPDGTRFVVVGYDDAGASQLTTIFGLGATPASAIVVIDVTDPTAPAIASVLGLSTATHTVSCVDPACTYLYSSGEGHFSIVDLTDITDPREVGTHRAVVNLSHDWDRDAAGVLWNVGIDGIAGYDVTDPAEPVLLNSSGAAGTWDFPIPGLQEQRGDWNNYILHNSYRPHARAFRTRGVEHCTTTDDETGPPGRAAGHDKGKARGRATGHQPGGGTSTTCATVEVTTTPSTERTAADVRQGELLLVTEEDYGTKPCETAGAFETWHVQQLDPTINADGRVGGGTIEPLDLWTTELLDGSVAAPAVGVFCSAHYFDHHRDGFVAQAWYQQGTRILDVRDPTDIRQVGYFFTGASEAWDAYWVPDRDADGQVIVDPTGEVVETDLLYVLDAVRGIDVLRVGLPASAPQDTPPLRAPVLPQWTSATAVDVARLETRRDGTWGFGCPILTPTALTRTG